MQNLTSEQASVLSGTIITSLLSRSPYREKWGPFVQRRRGNGINQRAVATFMAYELSDKTGKEHSPEQIKDRVARALKGDVFTDETVDLFDIAFEFTHQESEELRRAVAFRYQSLHLQQEVRKGGFLPEREENHVSLGITFVMNIDKSGFITHFEVTETVQIDVEETRFISPLFESAGMNQTKMLFGGELVEVNESDGETYNENNSIWVLKIKLPRVFYKGEIHQVSYQCDLNEGLDDLLVTSTPDGTDKKYINQATLGPFVTPHYNLTLILKFEEAPKNLTRNVWRSLKDHEKMVTRAMEDNSSLTFTAFYPLLFKTAFGFTWDATPTPREIS